LVGGIQLGGPLFDILAKCSCSSLLTVKADLIFIIALI
jgi:hypothetical protein